MAVYHQMGYHSSNLVDLPQMSTYQGAIFSPIDCTKDEVAEQICQTRNARERFEAILDPQLYAPATDRGKLKEWPYFPKDVDTADLASAEWWSDLNKKLADVCVATGVDAVCSPTVIPNLFNDRYYSSTVRIANELIQRLKNQSIRVLQTVMASLPELAAENRALEMASIVSRTNADQVYLVLVGSTEPRRELSNGEELKGAMQLINALERNEIPVVVGFCSSDLLLWKAAGASACASGKFFNLRRFTRQKYEEPRATGGGQLPYLFEEGLLAFLRQGDLIRVRKKDLLSEASQRNPFGQEVLAKLDEASRTRTPLKPWLGISWRHFLYWFADVEARLASGDVTAEGLLEAADANWSKLDDAKIRMEERQNDGSWIRSWLNTLSEYEAQRP